MRVLRNIREMREWTASQAGKKIGFVPTMGYLHAGHMGLIAASRKNCERTVASIFLNPAQFGANEDLATYPVDIEGDTQKLREAGADALFLPERGDIYPPGFKTGVLVEEITARLCGLSRPVFFRGVATVVLKLLNIVRPHSAFFGEKDWQQLQVVRTLVRDLNLDVDIVSVPTVREADGLAMSSRNAYLGPQERAAARVIPRSLETARTLIAAGETSAGAVRDKIFKTLSAEKHARVEYISICDPETFSERETITGKTLIALAVRIGETRLIDNCMIEAK